MFPLRPVTTVAEDMQFRTGNAGQQTQTRIHRHKAVVAPPDNQGLRFDFRQTWAKIRELFRISFQALNEVFQVIAARQHIIQARFKQGVGQIAGIKNEDIHHQLQVFDSRLTIKLIQSLNTFGWHRRKQTHAARTAAHQHQFADALRPVKGERHRTMAAHRVAQQVDFGDIQLIHHAFQDSCIKIRS